MLNDIELEESNILSSFGSNTADGFVIGNSIIKEEERLAIENEKIALEEENKYKLLNEFKENIDIEDELDRKRLEEIKEKRYKRLVHLLRNSKMYQSILKERMTQSQASTRKKESSKTYENKSKKKKLQSKYNISDVLTEENFENNMDIEEKCLEPDSDYFSKTRVTALGFTVSYKQPMLLEGGVLKDYQLKGLEWMINLFMHGVNGILGDEMGLGKTIQVISFICYLIEQDIQGPFLIVAPLSTITNWMSEFKRFAPKVPITLYHGTKDERKELFSKIFMTANRKNKKTYKVIITSYEIPLMDTKLKNINWYYLIVDEGHRLKNHKSLLSRKLREYSFIGRLLLTGTPLQNNLSELWSLLNFLLPEVFQSLDVFESWFDISELEKNGTRFIEEKFNVDVVNILQEILQPFLLRREKKDVNLELPPKKEILIYCPLTETQKDLYQATLDCSIKQLLKSKENETDLKEPLTKRRCFLNSPFGKSDVDVLKPKTETNMQSKQSEHECLNIDLDTYNVNINVRTAYMQLRKIVNHPYLILYPLKYGTNELKIDEDIVKTSGKLLVLDALLPKLKSRGHKVVVFSCFKLVLDILEDYAYLRNYTYCRLDGSTKLRARDDEISEFVSDPDVFMFFVSMRAGGLGINLTAADTAIIFDSDWNPQINLQSQDRLHRIGQSKPVLIYKLCTSGTIDEHIIERGNAKRRLEKIILQKGKYTMNFKNSNKANLMDLQELKNLLESNDHDKVDYSNESVFTDEELETLLDRSKLLDDSLPDDKTKKFEVVSQES